jgi:hypothetical protein
MVVDPGMKGNFRFIHSLALALPTDYFMTSRLVPLPLGDPYGPLEGFTSHHAAGHGRGCCTADVAQT